jgi:putative SOS response-associated peptidase YedK
VPIWSRSAKRDAVARFFRVLHNRTVVWRDSFKAGHCLAPASPFREPNSDVKPATWNWFALKDSDDPRPPFAFPGISRRYKGLMKKDGPVVEIAMSGK